VIIGGGYIGLETAASLRQLGAEVKVLEREERRLGRVTSPAIADFFYRLHTDKGVDIQTQKEVVGIRKKNSGLVVRCADETEYPAGMVISGVGIRVNTRLAEEAGLEIEDGIRVDDQTRSSDPHIFAIGDCTRHYHAHYDRWLRLESVQNAVDQARVAAAVICGQDVHYSSIPWFWSDQFDVKLQMVGLSAGHNETIIRKKQGAPSSFSVWYFKGEELLAVDAVNNAKAYILGGKCIRGGKKIAKQALADPSLPLKPANILE
jgi:3-phenylpropionate/trans-cinnamate dioxygenase ferredoxin reductase subunit